MADNSPVGFSEGWTVVATIDVSDSVALAASEDRDKGQQGLDVEGAGWRGYYREQFLPTAVRQGERLRKDPFVRIPGPIGWRRW